MFNKSNAKRYGAKGGRASAQARRATSAAAKREAEKRAAAELAAFEAFSNAETGTFDGFAMAGAFHAHVNTADALSVGESNDSGDCNGVHVGADGITVYFFCEPKNARKICRFNRSAYVF